MKKCLIVLLIISMVFSSTLLKLWRCESLADNQPVWPMFRYDSGNTGRCPYNTAQNGGGLKWKLNIQGLPAIGSDGTIYILCNYLYAINPDDGTEPFDFYNNSVEAAAHGALFKVTGVSDDGPGFYM